MKIFRNILLFLTAVPALWSCAGSGPEIPEQKAPPHTFIMYMMAENDIESYINANVNQALSGITHNLEDSARVFVFYDGKRETSLYEIKRPAKGKQAEKTLLKTYEGNLDSSDPQSLQTVLRDVKGFEEKPARTYGILLSSHATGWFPPELNDLRRPMSATGEGTILDEHDLRRAEGSLTKSFGDDNGQYMAIGDLVTGLSEIDFDYIIFDACFVACVESIYDLRGSADYIIASPVEVMGNGFPMHKIIPIIMSGSGSLEVRLARAADAIYNFYARGEEGYGGVKSVGISLADCSKVDKLAQVVKDIYSKGIREVDAGWVQALELVTPAHAFFDLENYMFYATKSTSDYYLLRETIKDVLIYENHTPSIFSGFGRTTFDAKYVCGLSTYIPRAQYPITWTEWNKTAWATFIGAPAAPANP